jgi:hypothetical protein
MSKNQEAKQKIIAEILENPVYMPNSGMYGMLKDALSKMPLYNLQNLELILRLQTQNKLDLKKQPR